MAVFVVDMQNPDQIPLVAEPLFVGLGAKVELHPAMNSDDLKKAISEIKGPKREM